MHHPLLSVLHHDDCAGCLCDIDPEYMAQIVAAAFFAGDARDSWWRDPVFDCASHQGWSQDVHGARPRQLYRARLGSTKYIYERVHVSSSLAASLPNKNAKRGLANLNASTS